MKKISNLLFIQLAFLIYSISGVFSKSAGVSESFINFIIFYGMSFCCLGIYAILWQKILNKNSLVSAYLNKGITLFWGLIFGLLFFGEKITITMIIGVVIVIFGVIIVNTEEVKK